MHDKGIRMPGNPGQTALHLELTRRCNNRCLYCHMGRKDPHPEIPPFEMTPAEIGAVLSRIRRDSPVESVALSGGEPLLREDLPEVLAIVKDLGITPVIATNGTLLTKDRVAATGAGATYVVTLLSHRRRVHDWLAGRPGAWESVLDGMANVREAGSRFVAAFVATRLNVNDLVPTAELAIALGAEGLMYHRLDPGGQAMRCAQRLLPPPATIRENLEALEELGRTYGLPVAVSIAVEPCLARGRKYVHLEMGRCRQGAESACVTIDPSGNVRVCRYSPGVPGRPARDRFSDSVRGGTRDHRFRDPGPSDCAGCDPAMKALCRDACGTAADPCRGTMSLLAPVVALGRGPGRPPRPA